MPYQDITTRIGGDIRSRDHGDFPVAGPIRLRRGRIHEVTGDSADIFAIMVASRLPGPVIWIGGTSAVESLTPAAVREFLDPARIILTNCTTRKEILWAGEQTIRANNVSCVVIELHDGPDLRTSRRLQIAAEDSGCTGIVLVAGRVHTSAAQTRWECVAIPGNVGSWKWCCIKNRHGKLGTWNVQWLGDRNDKTGETCTVHLAAASAA
ncbi:MAG: hypothetical protein OXF56_21355 [Rhodobacteraceae bacterium]|nr:hypothetical protein [Paracoccaceae bacterium]